MDIHCINISNIVSPKPILDENKGLNDIHVALDFASKVKPGMEMKSGYFNYIQRREMIAAWPFILPAYIDTRERNVRELVMYLMCKSQKTCFTLTFLQAVSDCVTMNPSIPSSSRNC